MGVITFQFIDTPPLLDVHVFTTSNYTGTPVETEGSEGAVRYTILYSVYFCVLNGISNMLPVCYHMLYGLINFLNAFETISLSKYHFASHCIMCLKNIFLGW